MKKKIRLFGKIKKRNASLRQSLSGRKLSKHGTDSPGCNRIRMLSWKNFSKKDKLISTRNCLITTKLLMKLGLLAWRSAKKKEKRNVAGNGYKNKKRNARDAMTKR